MVCSKLTKALTITGRSGTNSRTKMRQKLLLATLALAIPTSALASDAFAPRVTARAAEPVARCFAATQDAASRPWSFVPREGGGGTFSDAGAKGVSKPYYLRIVDRGADREVRLDAAGADAAVGRAIEPCL